jgi:F-type H+-transporting ATPase subunit f
VPLWSFGSTRRPLGLTRVFLVQSSGQGAGLAPLVDLYNKPPKGAAPPVKGGGLKERFFNGKNASASPLCTTILAIFCLGYTAHYQSPSIFSSTIGYMLTATFPLSSFVVRRYSALEYVNLSAPLYDRNWRTTYRALQEPRSPNYPSHPCRYDIRACSRFCRMQHVLHRLCLPRLGSHRHLCTFPLCLAFARYAGKPLSSPSLPCLSSFFSLLLLPIRPTR